jgi:hypothetical protein
MTEVALPGTGTAPASTGSSTVTEDNVDGFTSSAR